MEYRVEGSEEPVEAGLAGPPAGGEYTVLMGGRERSVRLLSAGPAGAEFLMDNRHHSVRYLSAGTSSVRMVVDGVPMEARMHAHLDGIVYKNSGGAAAGGADSALRSQIPGKVVKVSAAEGDSVKRGDTVAVLESMKMQVAVKSHRDGTVTSVKARQGGSVAKGDVIAEIE